MKTTKLFYATAIVLSTTMIACSSGGSKQSAEPTTSEKTIEISNITIDPAKSKVMWAGEAFGIYTHTGTLKLTQSDISIKDGAISGGSFTVDMTSIVPTDKNFNPEEGKTPEKLVGHLSSPDFFDVASYPTASFKVTGVEGNTATGMLTLRGKTHEEKVENITMVENGGEVKISGDLVFDRKKYDVAWDYPVQEMVLSDDVKVSVELIGS